ncbi:hypothetical protein ACTNB0_07680 [Lachnospiraceae bacterium HCP28S3_F9]|nr:hypothetical protein [Lachnospiraceae bacterium]
MAQGVPDGDNVLPLYLKYQNNISNALYLHLYQKQQFLSHCVLPIAQISDSSSPSPAQPMRPGAAHESAVAHQKADDNCGRQNAETLSNAPVLQLHPLSHQHINL